MGFYKILKNKFYKLKLLLSSWLSLRLKKIKDSFNLIFKKYFFDWIFLFSFENFRQNSKNTIKLFHFQPLQINKFFNQVKKFLTIEIPLLPSKSSNKTQVTLLVKIQKDLKHTLSRFTLSRQICHKIINARLSDYFFFRFNRWLKNKFL
jgi:hypothetical protein